MNDEQYKRFRKMQNEPITCLFKTHDKQQKLYFLISGSSGSKYKVIIAPSGEISCSCPDFKHGAKIQQCVCKHCLYVIFKELNIFSSLTHTFFNRCYFTPDEVKNIHEIYRKILQKNNLKDEKHLVNGKSG
jgi:hypothetical protein